METDNEIPESEESPADEKEESPEIQKKELEEGTEEHLSPEFKAEAEKLVDSAAENKDMLDYISSLCDKALDELGGDTDTPDMFSDSDMPMT